MNQNHILDKYIKILKTTHEEQLFEEQFGHISIQTNTPAESEYGVEQMIAGGQL